MPLSGSSPVGSDPDATTASSSARLYIVPPGDLVDTLGTAFARADLANSTLGAAATGQRRPTGRPWLEGTDGYSAARLWETLNFHVAGAAADTRTTIQVSYEVEGVYEAGPLPPSMSFWFDFAGSHLFGGSDASGFTDGHASGWVNPVLTWDGPGHLLFTAGYELEGEDTEIGLLMQLVTRGNLGSADFSHTASLAFDLPSNVSFSSASGVFLTAGTTPPDPNGVPEPASAVLVLAEALADPDRAATKMDLSLRRDCGDLVAA